MSTLNVDEIILALPVPSDNGGVPITIFTVDSINLDDNTTRMVQQSRNVLDEAPQLHCRIKDLIPGNSYIFRCRAESVVGPGVYSPWTSEILIPLVPVVVAEEDATQQQTADADDSGSVGSTGRQGRFRALGKATVTLRRLTGASRGASKGGGDDGGGEQQKQGQVQQQQQQQQVGGEGGGDDGASDGGIHSPVGGARGGRLKAAGRLAVTARRMANSSSAGQSK